MAPWGQVEAEMAKSVKKALTIDKSAVISDCGLFRYQLWRVWDYDLPILIFIMLNPSVADAEQDDPTLRRGMCFAGDNGFGGVVFLNLYAFRATKPKNMFAAIDPVGPDNDAHIRGVLRELLPEGGKVIVGWGFHGRANRIAEVLELLAQENAQPLCLGITAKGEPRHPLFIIADQPFIPFVSKVLAA
jgi:hypothetical protein